MQVTASSRIIKAALIALAIFVAAHLLGVIALLALPLFAPWCVIKPSSGGRRIKFSRNAALLLIGPLAIATILYGIWDANGVKTALLELAKVQILPSRWGTNLLLAVESNSNQAHNAAFLFAASLFGGAATAIAAAVYLVGNAGLPALTVPQEKIEKVRLWFLLLSIPIAIAAYFASYAIPGAAPKSEFRINEMLSAGTYWAMLYGWIMFLRFMFSKHSN